MSPSKQVHSFSEPNVPCHVCLVGNITPGNLNKSTGGSESRHSRPSLVIDTVNEEVGTSKDDNAVEAQGSALFQDENGEKSGNLEYCPDKIEEISSETIPVRPHKDDQSKDETNYRNPKILSLTKTKWLSSSATSRDGTLDTTDTLTQPTQVISDLSECSVVENVPVPQSSQKALCTVLALDKEHNLFGLSDTYMHVPGKPLKTTSKDDSKAVFHQTAIIQACYKTCCRRRSKTDLPSSLKCGGCRGRCRSKASCVSLCPPSCSSCVPCSTTCSKSCKVPSQSCWKKPSCCPKACPPRSCPSCQGCCAPACSKECPRLGFEVSVMKKPKYDPVYAEIEPKSSCILAKPMMARTCLHKPCCIPPSSCFPYLMPCYWPSRSGAPCSEPARCFHNPPCPRGRTPRSRVHPQELCPHGHPCVGKDKTQKCENLSCIGRNNEALAKALTEYNKQPPPSPPEKKKTKK